MALIQTVHLSMANFKSAPVVPAVQNDTDRQIKMVIDDFDLTAGLTGKITFVRSDGTHYEASATLDTATNSFTADIDQALTQPGRTMVQLKVTDALTVSTFSFVIFVEEDTSGTVTPQEGIDLVTAVEAAEDAADRAESAAETLELDATLTSATKAAQAKAVGDDIAFLSANIQSIGNNGAFTFVFDWEDGTVSGSTGGDSPSTTDERTGLYLCSDIEGYNFKKRTSNDLEVYYFDSNQAFMSPYVKKQADFTFSTPTNAVYVRFCTKKSTNVWTATKRSALALLSELNKLAEETDSSPLAQKNYYDGYYLSRQGELVADSNYCVSEKIPIYFGSATFVYGSGYDDGTKINLCSYTADGTLVDFWGPSTGQTERDLQSFGTGAKYVQFSWVRGTNNVRLGSATGSVDDFVYWEPRMIVGNTKNSAVGGTLRRFESNVIDENGTQVLAHNSLRSPKIYFYAKFSAFSAIKIGHGQSGTYTQYIKIDNTNVTWYTHGSEGSAVAHGLTFDEYIAVVIDVAYDNSYKITINTLDGTWSREMTYPNPWQGNKGETFVKNVGSTLTYWCITGSGDYQDSKWMFGDSYLTNYSDARWPYYLKEYGMPYTLINAFPGEESKEAYIDWLDALMYGTPEYAIWCLGMNDGDSGAVNANWLAVIQMFIADCHDRGITPILATIPNVPNIDHTYKNALVKSSGYRYIDFAEAVGAETANSTWYDGCLETGSSRVHPTADGARLLFMRALTDFPEFSQR